MAKRPIGRTTRSIRRAPLDSVVPERDVCLEVEDHSIFEESAASLFGLPKGRGLESTAARLAEQFVVSNRTLLARLDAQLEHRYDGGDVRLRLTTGSGVGAIPLVSPTTAKHDFGLVVQPRFPWAGIGPMLNAMGWRVAPTPLKLPLLRRSERRVPQWVLSSMILPRLDALLRTLTRRFEFTQQVLPAPRGRVDWNAYATRFLARGLAARVPCAFPDLRDDAKLLGAIRYALEQHIRALCTQRHHGSFVLGLIDMAEQMHRQVNRIAPYAPSGSVLNSWLARPMRSDPFLEGIQAIEWTVEERGLAGISDLDGIPWMLSMDGFFEAWVETTLASVAAQTGGTIQAGRNNETRHHLRWMPQFQGAQQSLVPDLLVRYPETTLVVDAKYKRHWEEIQFQRWENVDEEIRQKHRDDFLQVLAYANLAQTRNVVVCLAYPCRLDLWNSLRQRGKLFHRAEIQRGERSVQVWLTAIPMHASTEEVAAPFVDAVRRARSNLAA